MDTDNKPIRSGRKLLVGLLAATLIPLWAAIYFLEPDTEAGIMLLACGILAVLVAWRLLEEILPATYEEWQRKDGEPDKFVERLVMPVEDFIQNIQTSKQPEKDAILRQKLHHRLDGLAKRRNLLPAGGKIKEVTVLISDLRGFTIFADNYSASEVIATLNRYFTRMTRIITSYNGSVDKFIGDSIMAVFYPSKIGSNDDCIRAVCCAAKMQMAMDSINKDNEAKGMPTMYMGIGINTGRVVAGKIGSDLHSEHTIIGNEVNLASRIESASLRGQILLSENTYLMASDLIKVSTPFDVIVKGRHKPLQLYELKAVGPPYNLLVPEREIRRSVRVDVKIPFNFQICEGKVVISDYFEGQILNISAGGMLATTTSRVEPHFNIRFRLGVDILGRESDDIYGRVLNVKKDRSGLLYEMNVEFTVIHPEDSSSIKEMVRRTFGKTFDRSIR